MEVLCLIKYVHNEPFNELGSYGIPRLIFQAKVNKFGTNVGLNMLININFIMTRTLKVIVSLIQYVHNGL